MQLGVGVLGPHDGSVCGETLHGISRPQLFHAPLPSLCMACYARTTIGAIGTRHASFCPCHRQQRGEGCIQEGLALAPEDKR